MASEKGNEINYFNYKRRVSSVVNIGKTPMGGSYPIRLQSMTTADTTDTEGCITQIQKIIRAGGDYVRLTAQGIRQAENLQEIRQRLHKSGRFVPLIADIHFNPAVADLAATIVEKVRINPGNYIDAARTFKHLEYTEEEYKEELRKLEERFTALLNICKEHHTALRIGVNHGSLSDRIMSHYGDTPEGIVESCMEFLRVCKKQNFKDVVLSIKASQPSVMVRSVRLLVHQMDAEGMHYPLHLGVTEAGAGEDGRIKSAVGIGALLSDGIGDTIRVSLSEAPEKEIPVARHLRDYINMRNGDRPIGGRIAPYFSYLNPQRRTTHPIQNIGGNNVPIVIADFSEEHANEDSPKADFFYCGDKLPKASKRQGKACIVDAVAWTGEPDTYPCFTFQMLSQISAYEAPLKFLFLPSTQMDNKILGSLSEHPEVVVIAQSLFRNKVGEFRSMIHRMTLKGICNPVVIYLSYHYDQNETEDFQLDSSADLGALLFDGLCDGIYLHAESQKNSQRIPINKVESTAFAILQAAGLRRTQTEYISCPGCGRTLYNLEETLENIRKATKGLHNLKIAVMGCIVNGPGEMADADYGYMGAARGKISLYRKKECVEKNIPQEEAVEKLLELMRQDGVLK